MEHILPPYVAPTDFPFPPIPDDEEGAHIAELESVAIVLRLQEALTRQDVPLLPSPGMCASTPRPPRCSLLLGTQSKRPLERVYIESRLEVATAGSSRARKSATFP